MSDFVKIGNEFINLYSKDNPLLDVSDECFCLITNTTDFHFPLICKATILNDRFTDGMNKEYLMRINEILESPKILHEFVLNKTFHICDKIEGQTFGHLHLEQLHPSFDFSKNFFKVEAFFVRKTIEEISKLRDEYCKEIKNDLKKMISDIETLMLI